MEFQMTKLEIKPTPSKKLEINHYVEPKLLEDRKIPKLLLGKGTNMNENDASSKRE